MTPEELAKHKAGLKTKLLEKHKNLGDESSHYWRHISGHDYVFNAHEITAEEVDKVTTPELVAFYKAYIARDAPHRKKLSVHVKSQVEDNTELSSEAVAAIAEIEDKWDRVPDLKSALDIKKQFLLSRCF